MREYSSAPTARVTAISDRILDTTIRLETPEGTEVDVYPAGIGARSLAFLVDELIRWAIVLAGFTVGGFAGAFGLGFALVVAFLAYWLYGVVFEVFNNGQTPGKKLLALQVVHDDGTPIRLPASLLRNLLLIVDLLPAAYVVGFVTMVLSDRFRRLGDIVAGTMVVYRESIERVDAADIEGIRPPPVPLTVDEQSLLLSFADRRNGLSDERSEELATILAPMLGCPEGESVAELLKVASGVRGAIPDARP